MPVLWDSCLTGIAETICEGSAIVSYLATKIRPNGEKGMKLNSPFQGPGKKNNGLNLI